MIELSRSVQLPMETMICLCPRSCSAKTSQEEIYLLPSWCLYGKEFRFSPKIGFRVFSRSSCSKNLLASVNLLSIAELGVRFSELLLSLLSGPSSYSVELRVR
uniref:Uncharacterized protein n=1 Tax=Noccaea caerulescens TaxID=107243 RepID=A0A1J3IUD1_NOCCA